jgi:hypothetical protein
MSIFPGSRSGLLAFSPKKPCKHLTPVRYAHSSRKDAKRGKIRKSASRDDATTRRYKNLVFVASSRRCVRHELKSLFNREAWNLFARRAAEAKENTKRWRVSFASLRLERLKEAGVRKSEVEGAKKEGQEMLALLCVPCVQKAFKGFRPVF